MTFVLAISLATAAVIFAASAQAAQEVQRSETAAGIPGSVPAASGDVRAVMNNMDDQMKAMREMHQEMKAARTPEERNALMAEHTKMMQAGMGLMSEMPSGGTGGVFGEITSDLIVRQQIMEKRMQMMQSLMQMMIDHLPAAPAK